MATTLIRRSVVKAVTYRIMIMRLDFATIFLLTDAVKAALGFMIISNIYTTAAYLIHERMWTKINWGVVEA